MNIRAHSTLTLLLLLAKAALLNAQGGPPVITDDPWTPRPNHWEINSGWTVEKAPGHSVQELPIADLNYGWGRHVQLKVEAPWLVASEAYVTHAGLGNVLAGVKWRFADDVAGFAASLYPQLQVPRSHRSATDLGNGTAWQLLLPLEVARSIGSVDVDAELGYWFAPAPDRVTIGGVAVGYSFGSSLELVAECNAEGVRLFAPAEAVCGVGTRADITEHIALMGAIEPFVGGSAADRPHLRTYFGAQTHVRGGGLWKGRRHRATPAGP